MDGTGFLFNILLYAVMLYMLWNIIKTSKGQNKNKKLIDCVNSIKEKDVFFTKTDALLEEGQDDPVLLNKARIIKLWGVSYHKEYERFEETLEPIDLNALITMKKNKPSMEMNEDSFFYVYLGIPNILYKDQENELRKKLLEKTTAVDEKLQDTLVRAISVEINKFYDNEGDRGLFFCEKVLDGDYSEYTYGKSLIGLYKSILNATAARIYLDHGDNDKYQETVSLLKDFNLSGVGRRWLESLNLQVADEASAETDPAEENGSDDKETFQITSESAKQADVIDAEVTREEEKKDDHE